jgi:DNA polymerase-1
MNTCVLLDVSAIFFRSYYALTPSNFVTSQGLRTNAIYGLYTTILNLHKTLDLPKDSYDIIACLDPGKKELFRTKMSPTYKSQRKDSPEDLCAQFPYIRKVLDSLNIKYFSKVEYEADDLIASFCKHLQYDKIIIFSADKDMNQLLEIKNVIIYNISLKKYIDRNFVISKFDVTPEQFTYYQALVGDVSDNIKGIYRVGPKTAVKIIKNGEDKKLKKLIDDNKDVIELNLKLVTLEKDIDGITSEITGSKIKTTHLTKTLLEELEFIKIIKALKL